MIKEVEFPSEGAIIRGLLFLPDAPPDKLPLVIMAHGTSATVYMVADKYADAFRRSGFAVLPGVTPYWMYTVYCFDEIDAKRFIDALYTMIESP